MQQLITLIKGDKLGIETDYRDALPVNMSAVIRPMFGAQGYMLQQPGLTQYGTGEGIDRGGLYNDRFSDHYRVSNGSFISVAANGATVILGSIPGTDTASLPYSFNSQAIIADGRMWLYSPGNFNEITDTDLGDPIDGVWVDNVYFLTDGEYIYHTDLADESSIDPLKFATAEFMPDKSLGVAKTSDDKVMVFGRYSIEYFTNVAQENFSFTRVQTRAVKAGIVGTHAKAEMLDRFYILGGRKEEGISVHVVGVGSVDKVASREVDKLIGQYTETQLQGVVLEARVEDDYQYLLVHLPNETLLYNYKVAQSMGYDYAWTILKTDVQGNLTWRGKHGLFEPRKGVWVYGDKRDSTIGILDETVATHYDEIAEWLLYTPLMNLETLSINQLDFETIPGFTSTSDATVSISLTYDGSFYGTEWYEMYGLPSHYGKNFILRALGYVSQWVGIKLRGATRSRMAFGAVKLDAS